MMVEHTAPDDQSGSAGSAMPMQANMRRIFPPIAVLLSFVIIVVFSNAFLMYQREGILLRFVLILAAALWSPWRSSALMFAALFTIESAYSYLFDVPPPSRPIPEELRFVFRLMHIGTWWVTAYFPSKLRESRQQILSGTQAMELQNRQMEQMVRQLEHEVQERRLMEGKLRMMAQELTLIEARERRKIATALHDSVCQNLVFLRRKVDDLLSGVPETALTEEDGRLVKDTMDEVRQLINQLSPAALYIFGLEAALKSLIDRLRRRTGLGITLDYELAPMILPEEHRVFLYDSTQELLINVMKHAQATSVAIQYHCIGSELHVQVCDNGVGFQRDLKALWHTDGGYGLFSIQQRLECYNGRLHISSPPAGGACVEIIFPLASEPARTA